MLVSQAKQEDLETLKDIWGIIETCVSLYAYKESEELAKYIKELMEWAERLKEKTRTHDYTPDDALIKRVDEILNYQK